MGRKKPGQKGNATGKEERNTEATKCATEIQCTKSNKPTANAKKKNERTKGRVVEGHEKTSKCIYS